MTEEKLISLISLKNKLQQILYYLLAGSCLYLGKTVPEVLSTS